jgi:pilus assembly protein Flp/PilA
VIKLRTNIKRFVDNESGATAIEYGVIIALLSLAIIGPSNSVWVTIKDKFLYVSNVILTGNT